MAYTGAWRRTQRFTPMENPNLGSGIRGDHLNPTEPLQGFREPTPTLPDLPTYLYPQDDYLLLPPIIVHDPVINEPLGHEFGTVQEGGQSEAAARVEAYHAHMADRGAAAVHHHGERIARATRDTYVTQRAEMGFPSTGSRAALTRGRNAWPENNPDGPPAQGHFIMRWIDRQFTRRGIKTDMQPLRPYRAGLAAQSPALAEGSVYVSPFAKLASARLLKLTTPQVRRVPRPPDDDVISDGTADPQYATPAYWDGW